MAFSPPIANVMYYSAGCGARAEGEKRTTVCPLVNNGGRNEEPLSYRCISMQWVVTPVRASNVPRVPDTTPYTVEPPDLSLPVI